MKEYPSPYVGNGNNPINLVDPDGRCNGCMQYYWKQMGFTTATTNVDVLWSSVTKSFSDLFDSFKPRENSGPDVSYYSINVSGGASLAGLDIEPLVLMRMNKGPLAGGWKMGYDYSSAVGNFSGTTAPLKAGWEAMFKVGGLNSNVPDSQLNWGMFLGERAEFNTSFGEIFRGGVSHVESLTNDVTGNFFTFGIGADSPVGVNSNIGITKEYFSE